MKTTDSVMREKIEKIVLKWSMGTLVLPPGANTTGEELTVQSISVKDLQKLYEDLSHSIAEARREWVEEMRGKVEKLRRKEKYSKEHYSKDGSCDICHGNWEHLESCDYAIYRQTGYVVDSVLKLLTGDNPESECKVCHRTSDVVDMSKCPFCEHDQELIREGHQRSDRDTRRGE